MNTLKCYLLIFTGKCLAFPFFNVSVANFIKNFPAAQILREIRCSGFCVLILMTFLYNFSVRKFHQNLKSETELAEIDFTENLGSKKCLFLQCHLPVPNTRQSSMKIILNLENLLPLLEAPPSPPCHPCPVLESPQEPASWFLRLLGACKNAYFVTSFKLVGLMA